MKRSRTISRSSDRARRGPRAWARGLAAVLALSLAAPPARAWGPQGHRVIAKIAMDRLTPRTEAAIRSLLLEGDSLADISDWADHEGRDAVPGSATWHYVNTPLTAAHYDDRDCAREACVVAKIKEMHKILVNNKAPLKERRRALLFLVHLVEDVHQPLHVGDNNDRGGNRTQIQFNRRGTNLHAVWDGDMIHAIGGSDATWVRRLKPYLTRENAKKWSSLKVEDWADESLAIAKKAYLWPSGSRTPMPSGTSLGKDYLDRFAPVLEERLAQAGVRLANELNAIFDEAR